MKTTRKISSEQQFNSSQPCASDMHNGCDKCEPKSDTIEVPVNTIKWVIGAFYDGEIQSEFRLIETLEALLKEQSK